MSLERCDDCGAYQSVRWINLDTGELASDFDNAAQLCLDCQGQIRAAAEESIAADD